MDITGLVQIVAYVANNTMIVKLSNMPSPVRKRSSYIHGYSFKWLTTSVRLQLRSIPARRVFAFLANVTTRHNLVQIVAYVVNNTMIVKLLDMPLPCEDPGVRPRMCPSYPQRDRKKATKWGGVSESPYKKDGPVSVLGRAR